VVDETIIVCPNCGSTYRMCDGCPNDCAANIAEAAPSASPNSAMDAIAVLRELVDLVQAHIDGEYEFDSFTLQPAQAVLQQHQ